MNDAYAQLTARDSVRIERLMPGPIERLWEYLTDGEKRATWFAGGEMPAAPGSTMTLMFRNSQLTPGDDDPAPAGHSPEGFAMESRVLEYDPPRVLAFTMAMGGGLSEVRMELAPQGRDVKLVVTHRQLPQRSTVVNVSGGWHVHLDILAARLRGEAPPPFWRTHAKLAAEYERRIPAG